MTSVWFYRAVLLLYIALGLIVSCSSGDRDRDALDTDFVIPRTEVFADTLSTYGLYQGDMDALQPAEGVHLYEISSTLFTDYSEKQRLIKLPEGQQAKVLDANTASYPDGTVVAKTFMYPKDFRDASLGRRIIETRLMVKTDGVWNVATYIWNEAQSEAMLSFQGQTTKVQWVSKSGEQRTTDYEIPGEVACVTCHQDLGLVALLGLTPRDLNREVSRGAEKLNQLTYLATHNVFEPLNPSDTSSIIDYKDTTQTQERRARAYLDMNCSHCHQPDAWPRAAREDLDLRYGTSFERSGILEKRNNLIDMIKEGEMPFVGTTVLDDEGIDLTLGYLRGL